MAGVSSRDLKSNLIFAMSGSPSWWSGLIVCRIGSSLEELLLLDKIRPYFGKKQIYKPILKKDSHIKTPIARGWRTTNLFSGGHYLE